MATGPGWLEFIREQAPRYLYGSGHSQYESAEFSDVEALERLLSNLSNRDIDAGYLAGLHFLLRQSVQGFFHVSLPDLVRGVSHATTAQNELALAGIRGQVVWPETLRYRASGLRSHFVVRRLESSMDVPENQLLKWFVAEASELVSRTVAMVGTGNLMLELDSVRRAADLALASPYLREVMRPRRITSLMRQRAMRHRRKEYRLGAALSSELMDVAIAGRWSAIVNLLTSGWIVPMSDDDVFEVFVLLKVMKHLAELLGEPETYVVRAGRDHIAEYRQRATTVRVYFDQAPRLSDVSANSEYLEVISNYVGIIGSLHRPDITLEVSRHDQPTRWLLIDMKNTNTDDYVRESIYKGFGYVVDFAELWRPEDHPRVVIVFPSAGEIKAGRADLALSRGVMLVTSDDAGLLGRAISAGIGPEVAAAQSREPGC
jgi:hypothetical protein